MNQLILKTFCTIFLCLTLVAGARNSLASPLITLDKLNLRTRTIAWDADTNGQITNNTKNVGVALNVTNDSPYEIYLQVQGSSSLNGIFPSISIQNNICKSSAGSRICTSKSDGFTLPDSLFVSRVYPGIPEDIKPFSSFKINLGSFPLSSAVTTLPIDIGTSMNYVIFADSKYQTKLFNITPYSNDPVYIPAGSVACSPTAIK